MPDYPFWCRRIEKEIQFCLKTIYIRNHDFSRLSSGLRDIYICQSTFFPLRFFVCFLKQNISIISKHDRKNYANYADNWNEKLYYSYSPRVITIKTLIYIFLLVFFLNIYLAASGLSYGTWDLLLHHTDSLAVVLRLIFSPAHGILVLWPEFEPTSPALQGGFLTTGLPGKSL